MLLPVSAGFKIIGVCMDYDVTWAAKMFFRQQVNGSVGSGTSDFGCAVVQEFPIRVHKKDNVQCM